jgi:hypothetical protein
VGTRNDRTKEIATAGTTFFQGLNSLSHRLAMTGQNDQKKRAFSKKSSFVQKFSFVKFCYKPHQKAHIFGGQS